MLFRSLNLSPTAEAVADVRDYHMPVNEILDLTEGEAAPNVRAALGDDFRVTYPHIMTMREGMIRLRHTEFIGGAGTLYEQEREARAVRIDANQLRADAEALTPREAAMTEEKYNEAVDATMAADPDLAARATALRQRRHDLDVRAVQTFEEIADQMRLGKKGEDGKRDPEQKLDVPLKWAQIMDGGMQTDHREIATAVRVMAKSSAMMGQMKIIYHSLFDSVYALAMKGFPQETLWPSQEAMQMIFKDKTPSNQRMVFFGFLTLAAFVGGMVIWGFWGAVGAIALAYLSIIWYSVGTHDGDKPGKVRSFGKQFFNVFTYYMKIVRPNIGAAPGEERIPGDEYGNLIRLLYTTPNARDKALSEDEFQAAESELLDQGCLLILQAMLREDPMWNWPAETKRMMGKWSLVFDMGSILASRLFPSIKDRPHLTAFMFGSAVGLALATIFGGIVLTPIS
mgnify:CR=1 FL=1